MSLKPRFSEKAKRMIANAAINDARPQKELALELAPIVAKIDGVPERKIDTIIGYIRAARRNLGEEDKKQWSPAIANQFSQENLESVFRLWRLRNIKAQRFTAREAKWVSILSTAIHDTLALSLWAYTYANRELACSIMKQELDVSDLDPIWSSEPWELAIAYLVGEASPPEYVWYQIAGEKPFDKENEPIPVYFPHLGIGEGVISLEPRVLHQDAEEAERGFLLGPEYNQVQLAETAFSDYADNIHDEGSNVDGSLTKLLLHNINKGNYESVRVLDAPLDEKNYIGIKDLHFSREQERVYTMWLRYLGKGPKLSDLSWNNCLGIILELREWVNNHKLAEHLEDDEEGLFGTLSYAKLGGPLSPLFLYDLVTVAIVFEESGMPLVPKELLARVGYAE